MDWIGLCTVLCPRPHSIGYMGDGFYRSKDPTNSIKVLKEKATWDHTVLLATRHKRTHPALTPASNTGTRFTYPGGMEG